jgi:predicted RNA-binding Zn-ribbon protein involved in translation (DUF1610 family)
MFCPNCGDEMIDYQGTLLCERGGMALSENMLHKLHETFILKTRKPEDHELLTGENEDRFCPDHGLKMINKDSYARCPICNLSVSEFIYQLIRYNPHENI